MYYLYFNNREITTGGWRGGGKWKVKRKVAKSKTGKNGPNRSNFKNT